MDKTIKLTMLNKMSTEYSFSASSVALVPSLVSSVGSIVSVSSRTNTKNYRIRNNFPNLLPLPSRSINKLYYTTTTEVLRRKIYLIKLCK